MRAKWKPSPEQLEAAIDAAVARIPLERAAALLNISPRTLRAFLNRLERARAQSAVSSGVGGSLAAETAGKVPLPEGGWRPR
jgi:hypothetical protein